MLPLGSNAIFSFTSLESFFFLLQNIIRGKDNKERKVYVIVGNSVWILCPPPKFPKVPYATRPESCHG